MPTVLVEDVSLWHVRLDWVPIKIFVYILGQCNTQYQFRAFPRFIWNLVQTFHTNYTICGDTTMLCRFDMKTSCVTKEPYVNLSLKIGCRYPVMSSFSHFLPTVQDQLWLSNSLAELMINVVNTQFKTILPRNNYLCITLDFLWKK